MLALNKKGKKIKSRHTQVYLLVSKYSCVKKEQNKKKVNKAKDKGGKNLHMMGTKKVHKEKKKGQKYLEKQQNSIPQNRGIKQE